MLRISALFLIFTIFYGCASNTATIGYAPKDFRCTGSQLTEVRKKLGDQKGLRELAANVGVALPAYSDWLIGNHAVSMKEAEQRLAGYRLEVAQEVSAIDALIEKLKSCPTSMEASYDAEIQALERKAHYQKFDNLLTVKEKFIRYADEDLQGWHQVSKAHADALVFKNNQVELEIKRWLYQREGMRRLIKVAFTVTANTNEPTHFKTVLPSPRKGFNHYAVAIETDNGKLLHAEKVSPRLEQATAKTIEKGESVEVFGSFMDLTTQNTQALHLVVTDELIEGIEPFKVQIPRSFLADARLKMPPLYERVSK